MKIKNVFLFVILILSTIVVLTHFGIGGKIKNINNISFNSGVGGNPKSPTSIKMYELIEKFSDKYEIPKYVAYNVAFLETRYEGPFDWTYNPYLTSSAGAVGPMQIMPSTANYIQKETITKDRLKTDLKLNVEISMKLLRKLHDRYGDWSIVCGCYNTGRPIVNDYARFCSSNKNYRSNWVYIE